MRSGEALERRKEGARRRARDSYWRRKEADPDGFAATLSARAKAYRLADLDASRAAGRAKAARYASAHRESIRKRSREYMRTRRAVEPEKEKARTATWRANNPEKVRAIQLRAWHKKMQNPSYRLRDRISHLVRASLRRGSKRSSITTSLGYSMQELRAHIERQFVRGMGWHNMDKWHIDHIVPLSSFEFTSDDDPSFRAAWALTNLRPLWAKQNVKKADTRAFLV